MTKATARIQSRRVRLSMLLAAALIAVLLLPAGCGVDGAGIERDDAGDSARASAAVDYSFAVVGDSHTVGLDNGILARAVSSAVENGAAFMVHTGDVSNIGASDELRRYRDLVEQSELPVYSIPGNHDVVSAGDVSLFMEVVGPPYSSFDHAGDHFVLVDSSDEQRGIDEAQFAWLSADLDAGSGSRYQFIFTHIPPGEPSADLAWLQDEPGYVSGLRLVELARRHDNVEAFFAGHVHGFLKYELGGVDALISGGGGAQPYPLEAIGYHHYLLVKVKDDGVDVEVVRL